MKLIIIILFMVYFEFFDRICYNKFCLKMIVRLIIIIEKIIIIIEIFIIILVFEIIIELIVKNEIFVFLIKIIKFVLFIK